MSTTTTATQGPIPAAGYFRFSSDRQSMTSLTDQRRVCHRFAESHGFSIVAEYEDAGESGSSTDRDGLQELLGAAGRGRKPPFAAILVDDQSRLSRSIEDTLRITRQLHERGIEIIDCSTGTSSRGSSSKVLTTVRGLISEIYIDDLRHRTRRGLEGRAIAGGWTGGSCYGLRTEPELTTDPHHPIYRPRIEQHEAEVVRRIFSEYAGGASLKSLIEGLNREGVPAPADGRAYKKVAGWSKSQLFYTLRNRRYLGEMTYNQREWFFVIDEKGRRRRRYKQRPESEWVRTVNPELAIVDRENWDKVQARHRHNKPGPGCAGRTGRYEHMLSSLMRCGVCGS